MNTTKEEMLETLNKSSTLKKSRSVISPALTPIAKEEGKREQELPAVLLKPVKLHNIESVIAAT